MKSTTTLSHVRYESAALDTQPSAQQTDGQTPSHAERRSFAPPEISPLELFLRDATQRRRWRDRTNTAS